MHEVQGSIKGFVLSGCKSYKEKQVSLWYSPSFSFSFPVAIADFDRFKCLGGSSTGVLCTFGFISRSSLTGLDGVLGFRGTLGSFCTIWGVHDSSWSRSTGGEFSCCCCSAASFAFVLVNISMILFFSYLYSACRSLYERDYQHRMGITIDMSVHQLQVLS